LYDNAELTSADILIPIVDLNDTKKLYPGQVLADRGYPSSSFREHIWSMGAKPAIPTKSNVAPVACPDWIYCNRNVVEMV
jgi:hypothetical protein